MPRLHSAEPAEHSCLAIVSTTAREPHLTKVSIDIFRLIDATLFRWLNQYISLATIAARHRDTLQRCIRGRQEMVLQYRRLQNKERDETHISGNALNHRQSILKTIGQGRKFSKKLGVKVYGIRGRA
jgi:hypothetical protein